MRGQIKLEEIGAQRDMAIDVGVMDAFKAAIDQQTEMVKAAGGWVASLSASVRPVTTYFLLALYGISKAVIAIKTQSISEVWSSEDMALLGGVINYYFINRTLEKRGAL